MIFTYLYMQLWQKADEKYLKTAKKMAERYNNQKKVVKFQVGDIITIRVPRIDRTSSDLPHLLCVVVDVKGEAHSCIVSGKMSLIICINVYSCECTNYVYADVNMVWSTHTTLLMSWKDSVEFFHLKWRDGRKLTPYLWGRQPWSVLHGMHLLTTFANAQPAVLPASVKALVAVVTAMEQQDNGYGFRMTPTPINILNVMREPCKSPKWVSWHIDEKFL